LSSTGVSCDRTDGGVSIGFGWEEFDCGQDVHCSVEWGVTIAGRRTDLYYCDRPTGDSFSYDEVCVVGSGGTLALDRARTAALDGPEFPCPYHSED